MRVYGVKTNEMVKNESDLLLFLDREDSEELAKRLFKMHEGALREALPFGRERDADDLAIRAVVRAQEQTLLFQPRHEHRRGWGAHGEIYRKFLHRHTGMLTHRKKSVKLQDADADATHCRGIALTQDAVHLHHETGQCIERRRG